MTEEELQQNPTARGSNEPAPNLDAESKPPAASEDSQPAVPKKPEPAPPAKSVNNAGPPAKAAAKSPGEEACAKAEPKTPTKKAGSILAKQGKAAAPAVPEEPEE